VESFILILHVLVAIGMTGLILLQQGKGAEMGASFGAGSSQTVFGSAGSAGFMVKFTAVLTAIFFVTSLTLAIYAKKNAQTYGVIPEAPVTAPKGDVPAASAAQQQAPAAPVAPANPDSPVAPTK
jgi:preprotein translocase subunit SecG